MAKRGINDLTDLDIRAGMMTTETRKDRPSQDNPTLIAKRKRIQEKKNKLEDERLEAGDFEIGEFDSNWSTAPKTRRNDIKGRRY